MSDEKEVEDTVSIPEGLPGWHAAYVVNLRNKILRGVWEVERVKVKEIFDKDTIAEMFANEYARKSRTRRAYVSNEEAERLFPKDLVEIIYKDLRKELEVNSNYEKYITLLEGRMNDDLLRQTLEVLTESYFDVVPGTIRNFNGREIAARIDEEKLEEVYGRLVSWVFPTLHYAKYTAGYKGFAIRGLDNRKPHRIKPAQLGIKVFLKYIEECYIKCLVIDDELQAKRKEG